MPVDGSNAIVGCQSRGIPSGPPQACVNRIPASDGNHERTNPRSISWVGSWRSYSRRIGDPKRYGAPRPPNRIRPSSVRDR